jgi:hypothetical protein
MTQNNLPIQATLSTGVAGHVSNPLSSSNILARVPAVSHFDPFGTEFV